MKKNVPIITFLSRTWMLCVLMVVSNYLSLSKYVFYWKQLPAGYDGTPGAWVGVTLFDILGGVLYALPLISTVSWFALLAIHLYYRETVDKDAHDGTYVADWHNMGDVASRHRVWAATVIRIGFLIGFCILCAGLAKG